MVSDTRLMTGTMWHTYFEDVLRGKAVMCEVRLDPWLPEGWAGTADWIMWSDEYKAFVLGDLKTIKGEGIKYINIEGIKWEHQWQLSAYWYALKNMGLRLVDTYCVLYLPMNGVVGEDVRPVLMEGKPLDEDLVLGTMWMRFARTKEYLNQVDKDCMISAIPMKDVYINEFLAPPQERVLSVRWNKDKWDVKWLPHWSTAYCPYPDELCDCNTQPVEKVGHYALIEGDVKYMPRKGYEKTRDIPELTNRQKEKLIAASTEGTGSKQPR